MASIPGLVGSICVGWAWLLAILACGLPLFSGWNCDCASGSGCPAWPVSEPPLCLSSTTGSVFVGSGLWGQGRWYYGTPCDQRDAAGDSCYEYVTYDSGLTESWLRGGEASSIICVLCGFVALLLSCGALYQSSAIGAFTAALFCALAAVFAIVPFAVWEQNMCSSDSDCARSWAYAYQIVSFLVFALCAVLFVLAGLEPPGDD